MRMKNRSVKSIMRVIVSIAFIFAMIAGRSPKIMYAGAGGNGGTSGSGGEGLGEDENQNFQGKRSAYGTYRSYLSDLVVYDVNHKQYKLVAGGKPQASNITITYSKANGGTTNLDGEYIVKYKEQILAVYRNYGSYCELDVNYEAGNGLEQFLQDKQIQGGGNLKWACSIVRIFPKVSGKVITNTYREYTSDTVFENAQFGDKEDANLAGIHIYLMDDYACELTQDEYDYILTHLKTTIEDQNDPIPIPEYTREISVTIKLNGGTLDGYRDGDVIKMTVGGQFWEEPEYLDADGNRTYHFWGWTESTNSNLRTNPYNQSRFRQKQSAYNDGLIAYPYTIPNKSSVTLYAIYDKLYPGADPPNDYDGCLHDWEISSTYTRCDACGERYVSSNSMTCRICGEKQINYPEHYCDYSEVTFNVGSGCPNHPGLSSNKTSVTKRYTTSFVFPSTLFGGQLESTHEIVEWIDEYGNHYSVGDTYVLDGRDGRVAKGTDISFTAVWKDKTYTVHYIAFGREVATQSIYLGQAYRFPTVNAGNYTLLGWYRDSNIEVRNGDVHGKSSDVTIESKWQGIRTTGTIKLNLPAGMNIDDCAYRYLENYVFTAEYGQKFNYLDQALNDHPEMQGLTFLGFYIHGTDTQITGENICRQTSDFIIDCKWEPKKHKFTLDPQGVNIDQQYVECAFGETFVLPSPTRTGYRFGGWYTMQNGKGKKYVNGDVCDMTRNTRLYAYWIPNKYTLTFDYCLGWKRAATNVTGNEIPSMEVTYDQAVGTLPAPTRDGYYFIGWVPDKIVEDGKTVGEIRNSGKNIVNEFTVYERTENLKLYAVWEPIVVYIGWDYNYDYTEAKPLPGSEGEEE